MATRNDNRSRYKQKETRKEGFIYMKMDFISIIVSLSVFLLFLSCFSIRVWGAIRALIVLLLGLHCQTHRQAVRLIAHHGRAPIALLGLRCHIAIKRLTYSLTGVHRRGSFWKRSCGPEWYCTSGIRPSMDELTDTGRKTDVSCRGVPY